MLQPTRTKYRKAHKGRIHGHASRGEFLNYGSYGLKAIEPERIISKQIEAARVSLTRYMKRTGKVWLRIFPNIPISKKPTEVRMGKGKGAPEYWACRVKPGRIIFEVDGVSESVAKEALYKASKIILPGLTRQAQYSGAPLPLPILTSVGFLEIGILGKILSQTFPVLFIYLVKDTLAASICFEIILSGSIAFSP
jgi:large subunit ribosomal protein L16